jgi:hypothetical protein
MKLELGYQTNQYQIIYDGNNFLPNLDSAIKTSALHYMSVLPKSKQYNYNIWFDHKNKVCFSQAQYKDTMVGKDHHFLTCTDEFVYNHNLSWDVRYNKPFFNTYERSGKKFIFNNELGFEENKALHNLNDKSVVVVCGGPSSNDVSWENIKADHIWTCNQFYKNIKFKDIKANLVVTHPEVVDILNDEEFHKYLKKYDSLVSFEVEQGTNPDSYNRTRDFCDNFNYNTNFFHTRYRGQPGLGLRMIAYAICLGFEDIYFVGIDGRSKKEIDGNLMHAFDGNKNIPNWYKRFGDDFQDRQFVIFWDYIQKLKTTRKFSIYNLGEGKDYNVLSKLFADTFPLPNEIKEVIEYEK